MAINQNKLFTLCILAAFAVFSVNAWAANIDPSTARANADQFLKHLSGAPSLKSVTASDLQLAYTQASAAVDHANAYYAFNIAGGGYVIVAGEDRAAPVLGYSDNGHLDFNNLPEGLKALLASYQEEIEYLQAHPSVKMTPVMRSSSQEGVAPLIKSLWGQELPYCLQCPIYQGEYCVVGCVATAMSQVMHYWRYPTSSNAISSYYCYDIGQTVEALPATNFEYSKMLNSYCHWDWDLSELIQDSYTDAQAQAVAKLARYCGQAVNMGYSPEGSGAYVSSQLNAMKNFGYNNARDVSRSSWWSTNYTDEEWEAMIRAELNQGRPILYSANDYAAGGHAFVCDGYDNQGMFHFNFGWYGTCNGWYVSTALNMTHRDGDELHFNYDHEMIINLVPPTYCLISADGISTTDGLMVLGESIDVQASHVDIMTSQQNIKLIFEISNASNRKLAKSSEILVDLSEFEQGSDVSGAITLPTTLTDGSYTLNLYYNLGSSREDTPISSDGGQLNVAGHVAKYNAPFTINDVTTLINYLLVGYNDTLDINDVTNLINVLLEGQ